MEDKPSVIYMNMPPSVKGMVIKSFDDGDDYYTIVLNPAYNREQQIQTYEHEMKHITAGDFDNMLTADSIEALRHAL